MNLKYYLPPIQLLHSQLHVNHIQHNQDLQIKLHNQQNLYHNNYHIYFKFHLNLQIYSSRTDLQNYITLY